MRSTFVKSAWIVALVGLAAPVAGARQQEAERKAAIAKFDTIKAALPDVLFVERKPEGTEKPGTAMADRVYEVDGSGKVVNYNQWVANIVFAQSRTPVARALGITPGTLAEPLRAQLKLPADRGLILNAVDPDGPAMAVGLAANDILLTLDGHPLAGEADLAARLAALGARTADLAILREGKPSSIAVGGRSLATFAPAESTKVPDYFVGLETRPVDDALRAHLPALPAGRGLLVESPTADGPAARAGIKANDILLAAGEAPLPDVDALRAAIKAAGPKPLAFKLLRGGSEAVVPVTPEVRKVPTAELDEVAGLLRLETAKGLTRNQIELYTTVNAPELAWNAAQPPAAGLDKRLDALDADLKALRAAIEGLQKAGKPAGK